ncbi:MAG: septum formation initiator family protein [Gammaproteobacteria bacterium]|nr:septum formation initiator family protein [Gammaproteobacteria bacterium]MDH3752002.1 septum formation initiator family protein [Gammaproteobacteria bacterium]
MNSRWMLVMLGVAALTLQGQLWFSGDGFGKTRDLRAAVAEQRAQNEELRERNQALDAEVINLKQSSEAAEERARTDLGMIGPKETFYQVVPVADAAH